MAFHYHRHMTTGPLLAPRTLTTTSHGWTRGSHHASMLACFRGSTLSALPTPLLPCLTTTTRRTPRQTERSFRAHHRWRTLSARHTQCWACLVRFANTSMALFSILVYGDRALQRYKPCSATILRGDIPRIGGTLTAYYPHKRSYR